MTSGPRQHVALNLVAAIWQRWVRRARTRRGLDIHVHWRRFYQPASMATADRQRIITSSAAEPNCAGQIIDSAPPDR